MFQLQKERTLSSQSLSATVKEVTTPAGATSSTKEDLDMAFLSAVVSADDTSWTANINVNGEMMKFKVDTGAEITAVTKLALTQLGKVQLHPTTKTLCGPDRKTLKVLGQTSATLSHCGGTHVFMTLPGRQAQAQPARVTSYQRFKSVQSHEFKLYRCYHQPISKCFYRPGLTYW